VKGGIFIDVTTLDDVRESHHYGIDEIPPRVRRRRGDLIESRKEEAYAA
jgi:hypothetical protein